MYSAFLLIVTGIGAAMNFEPFKDWIYGTEGFQKFCVELEQELQTNLRCQDLFGYSAVYMVFLGNSIFFLTMSLLTLNLTSSRQFRYGG